MESEAAKPKTRLLDARTFPIEEPEEGVYYAYANIINMNWTLTDVRLRFAELLQIPNEDSPSWGNQQGVILERASITIPWHQAKVLRDLLTTVVGKYEELNGELKQPQMPAVPNAEYSE